jgi:DNA-binding transcriptional ArsR family regulator
MKAASDPLSLSLRAVSDPVRRRILRLLSRRSLRSPKETAGMCAADLQQHTDLAQPTISHHMRVLAQAGLVHSRKLGTWVWYRRNETALRKLMRELRQQFD